MKAKFIFITLLTLLIGTITSGQKRTELVLHGVTAVWKNDTGPVTINILVSINNPSFSGNNFNSVLKRYQKEYINGKIVKDTISSFENADWAGTKNRSVAININQNSLAPNNNGKIILEVDNHEYYKGGNRSATKVVSIEISYKVAINNGKLYIENMQNIYPDGSKYGDEYKKINIDTDIIKKDHNQLNQTENLQEIDKNSNNIISIETNSITGKPWEYICSDGSSTLKIDVSLPYSNELTYKIKNGAGSISINNSTESGQIEGTVSLKSGKLALYFSPPKDIDENRVFYTKNLSQNRYLRYYTSEIIFEFTTSNNKKESKNVIINYCRTPVMLIHGFTGDKNTWELLDGMLAKKGFMTHRDDYYARNEISGLMDIAAQSFLLEKNIQNEIELLTKNNVKCQKLDIVSHSMGGLISRHYSWIHPTKGKYVRKIIMVGTPNHGIYNAVDLMSGKAAAYFSNAHKGMAIDVDATSRTMNTINSGEESGKHLNPKIEYGNIYVDRTDGVVEGRSARLNGVSEITLNSMKHSPAIPEMMGYGSKSITTDFMVFGKILYWLNNPIPKASLNMNKWNNLYTLQNGKEYDLSGNGDILRVNKGSLNINIELRKIVVNSNSSAEITYRDGSIIKIKPNTELSYNPNLTELLLYNGKTLINLKKQGSSFVVITPTIRAGVKGTCFEISTEQNGLSQVYLYEGKLEIENLSGIKNINTNQSINSSSQNNLSTGVFNSESRFKDEWSEITELKSLNSFRGVVEKPFNNIIIGGESIIRESISNENCIGKLKPQFLIPISGSPSNIQQQNQMRKAADHNNWELKWFKDSENNFKKGILPKEMSGTYRPNKNDNSQSGEYYSQTTTIFKPMKIKKVIGEADGFKLIHGDTQKEIYINNFESIIGTILNCGSYKIIVDQNNLREKSWITIEIE